MYIYVSAIVPILEDAGLLVYVLTVYNSVFSKTCSEKFRGEGTQLRVKGSIIYDHPKQQ